MLYREFGKAKEKLSCLGYGTMRFPIIDDNEANIDKPKAIKLLRTAIDNGVNYIDTAYPYHGGNSEKVVALALKDGYREKVNIATKLPSWLVESRQDMDRLLDEQLENLQVDCIDYYLLHALEKEFWENYKKHDVFDFIKKAKKNGKIRHIGFSFHDEIDVFKQIVDEFDWDFCMIQYNFMDTNYQAGKEGLLYASSKGLGICIMEPLKGGALVKNLATDIQKIWDSITPKRSVAANALRFVWDHPEVGVVISGMSDMDQLMDNIKTANESCPNCLNDHERKVIQSAKKLYQQRVAVNCTSCKYCMPCPHGVNIPLCFTFLNNSYMFMDIAKTNEQYHIFVPDENKANCCVGCGDCEKVCPQHIDIIAKLKYTAKRFKHQTEK